MCGIAGFVNNNGGHVDRAVLEAMNRAIAHRGPDEDGFYIHENVGLAMRRLSIIDLAGGKQPIHNEDKSKWIGPVQSWRWCATASHNREGFARREANQHTSPY